MHAVHRATMGSRRRVKPAIRESRRLVMEKVIAGGPDCATSKDRRIILNDIDVFEEIHHRIGRLDDDDAAERWGVGA
jgi:hypothetical protein